MAQDCWLGVGSKDVANEMKFVHGIDLTGNRGKKKHAQVYIAHIKTFCETFWLGRSEGAWNLSNATEYAPRALNRISRILRTSMLIDDDLIDTIIAAISPTEPYPLVENESAANVAPSAAVREFLDAHRGKILALFWM